MKKFIWIAIIGIISLSFTKVRRKAKVALTDTISVVENMLVDNTKGNDENTQSTVKSALIALNGYYTTHPDYKVDIEHSMFSSNAGLAVDENQVGFYSAYQGFEFSSIMGISIIQDNNLRVIMDSSSKIVMLAHPRVSEPFDISKLEGFLEMAETATIADSLDFKLITLNYNRQVGPISKLNLVISKNRLMRIDMWHSEEVFASDGTAYYPHSRVEYSNFKENKKIKKKALDISSIVKKTKDNYELTEAYGDYTLLDTRFN